MALIQVIKYEGDNSIFVWKHPKTNFNTFSQLIVHQNQEAVFFKNGQALDLFQAGRYTLSTDNIPLLRDEYYGEIQDYTRKTGVIETFIMLPEQAPERLMDRQTLWNEVEQREKRKDAQIAYSFNFALQNELSMEENTRLLRDYLRKHFISRGMICDVAIHLPEKGNVNDPNPHAHIKCPIRPLNKDGTWGLKQHKEEVLDEKGRPVMNSKGKPMVRWVSNTDWGRPETLNLWRSEWARMVNEAFEAKGLECRIDHRSLTEQGVDRAPQVHEGSKVRKMEQKGIRTHKGEWNRWIRETYTAIQKLLDTLKELSSWIAEIKAEMNAPKAPSLESMLVRYYDHRDKVAEGYGRGTAKAKLGNLKRLSELVTYIHGKNIHNGDDLESLIKRKEAEAEKLSGGDPEIRNRIKELQDKQTALSDYSKYLPVYQEYNKIFFKKSREKYKEEHRSEINRFQKAKRILGEDFDPENITKERSAVRTEIDELKAELISGRDQIAVDSLKEEIAMLKDIRRAVDFCIGKAEKKASDAPDRAEAVPEQSERVHEKVSFKAVLKEKKEESKRLEQEGQTLRRSQEQQHNRDTQDIS